MLDLWRNAPAWKLCVAAAFVGWMVQWMFYVPPTPQKPRPIQQQGQIQPEQQWTRMPSPAPSQPGQPQPVRNPIKELADKDPLRSKP